jgi:hypothetical protein
LVCKNDGGTNLSIKKGHKHPHHDHSIYSGCYYHPECIERVLTIPNNALCSECGVLLSQSWSWEELCERRYVSCKNCGGQDVFGHKGSCSKCHLPILVFHRLETVGSVYSLAKYHESCFQAVRRLSARADQASIDSKERSERIFKRAGCVGAITGFILGIAISSVITLSMFSLRNVPGGAIIAAGIIGTFLGGFIGAGIGELIASR